jgi:K+-sensing histidine kinase KdpD
MLSAQGEAQQADLRMRAAEEKAEDATRRMRAAEDEANQATAAALVSETKVQQAEVRSRAVEDQAAETAAKNSEMLEQLQQARGELVGVEERARLSEERFAEASQRVEVLEGQVKELKVRLTVAKTDLPIGAVPNKERSALKDALATEVRRPLTSIMGVSLALRHNDPDSRDGKELVRQLGTTARKLDRMVNVLLEIDRLADGTLRLNRRRTDLQALVRRVVEESPDVANRNVHMEAEKVVVPVDPFMVEEMVETLLSNASHRTSSASPVWVTVSGDPEGAIIAVDDSGAEVPEELRKALKATPEAQRGGAGRGQASTGLAVLQRLAEVHAGRAWVEEREGGGASFRVFLPDVTELVAGTGRATDHTSADWNAEEETETSEA